MKTRDLNECVGIINIMDACPYICVNVWSRWAIGLDLKLETTSGGYTNIKLSHLGKAYLMHALTIHQVVAKFM